MTTRRASRVRRVHCACGPAQHIARRALFGIYMCGRLARDFPELLHWGLSGRAAVVLGAVAPPGAGLVMMGIALAGPAFGLPAAGRLPRTHAPPL